MEATQSSTLSLSTTPLLYPNSSFLYLENSSQALGSAGTASIPSLVSWFPGPDSPYTAVQAVVIALVLLCVVIVTFVGNVLVCVAVFLVRKLRRPCNYLLVSLAVSDICVAVLVMPMALLNEVFGRWDFGRVMCDLWVSFDVLSCTASILNLCMISVDRYFAITKPLEYGVKRTPRRMIACVSLVWLIAACISLPPVLILGNEHSRPDGTGPPQCYVCQNFGYQIYATLWAFYLPLTVMIVVYYKIFRAARRIVREEKRAQKHLDAHNFFQPPPVTPVVKNGGTSPEVMGNSMARAASGASLLLTSSTTPTAHTPASAPAPASTPACSGAAGAGNISPGSSPAASTPAASGRQHRPSTTSTNTTCSGQLGSEVGGGCGRGSVAVPAGSGAGAGLAGRRSDESQCPMLGPPPRSPRSLGKRSRCGPGGKAKKVLATTSLLRPRHSSACSGLPDAPGHATAQTKRLRFQLAKERKASTTLGIIMSAFIFCWLPFFVLALVRPFLKDASTIPMSVTSLFLWLGYANSLLNPIIYATLNRDFRKPFQQILYFRCGSLNHMMREEFYQSQYGNPTHNYQQQEYCVVGRVTPPSGAARDRDHSAHNADDLGGSDEEQEEEVYFRQGSGQVSPGAVITASVHLIGNSGSRDAADESFL